MNSLTFSRLMFSSQLLGCPLDQASSLAVGDDVANDDVSDRAARQIGRVLVLPGTAERA